MGIVTDAENWYFMECALDGEGSRRLSEARISGRYENMESMASDMLICCWRRSSSLGKFHKVKHYVRPDLHLFLICYLNAIS